MPSSAPTRAVISIYLFASLCCLHLLAQAPKSPQRPYPSVPATASTTAPSVAVPAATPPSASVASSVPSQPAVVTYNGGQLSVSANNSSLSQILREISRETRMKITGGVADDHVFGTYGPASPAVVLAALLDGTGSNMLLVQGPGGGSAAPVELILTPRTGGPSPPSPHPYNDDQPSNLGSNGPNNPDSRPLPPPSVPVPATDPNPAAGGASNTPDPPPATTPSQDQSPNGVKTPQQIYDQLMRLRQQQQPAPPADDTRH